MLLHIPPFIIFILVTGVSTIVPAPENVSVSCNNFKSTVYWNYTEQRASTSFKLNISRKAGYYNEAVTTEHQYDLTPFIWRSADYMDIFWVTITATDGTHESNVRESPTLTFNDNGSANIICKLDFPPVELSVVDMKATVSFPNPHHFYRLSHMGHNKPRYEGLVTMDEPSQLQLPTAQNRSLITAHRVSSTHYSQRQHAWRCEMDEATCRHEFTVSKSDKYCVRLQGWMFDRLSINRILFKETEVICANEKDSTYLIFLAVLLSALVIVMILISLAVCKERAWTMTSSTSPKNLVFKIQSPQNMKVIDFPYESFSRIVAIKPAVSLFEISMEDPVETTSNSTGSEHSPSTPTDHMYMERRLSESSQQTTEEVELISETDRPVGVHVKDSAETESTTDSEEQEDVTSGYDRPQRLEVLMSPGDMVKCYGPG